MKKKIKILTGIIPAILLCLHIQAQSTIIDFSEDQVLTPFPL